MNAHLLLMREKTGKDEFSAVFIETAFIIYTPFHNSTHSAVVIHSTGALQNKGSGLSYLAQRENWSAMGNFGQEQL